VTPQAQAPAPAFGRVAVLGVGLIGGSVAGALRQRRLAAEVVGYAPGDGAREAQALGLIDSAAGDVGSAVAGAELVVVAAPIPAIAGLLAAAAPALAPGAVVTDCASTKASVVEAARHALGEAFERFVPGHPIAGAERHGPQAARANLFEGALAVVCPQPATRTQAVDAVCAMWAALGARLVTMDAAQHDAVFAEVSHWPHAVAFALCGAIAAGGNALAARQFAGAGLRDTTRIGASSPTLWADILLDNRGEVLDCARRFGDELDAVVGALRAGDRDELVRRFEAASRWRGGLT
jgi:prephenate dehydrogenase